MVDTTDNNVDKVDENIKKPSNKTKNAKTESTKTAGAKSRSTTPKTTSTKSAKSTGTKSSSAQSKSTKNTSTKSASDKSASTKGENKKSTNIKKTTTKSTSDKKNSTKTKVEKKSENNLENNSKIKLINDEKTDILPKENELQDLSETNENREKESKYDTISLKEIREAIENKVDKDQKKSIIKEVLVNLGIAIIMLAFLIIIMIGSNNISGETLNKDMKIITLFILIIGIFILEMSYKKDNSKIAMNGIETLVFGAANLCLIYVAKLYSSNLIRYITYISVAIAGYYVIKSILLSICNVRKFKNDNNDIKEIIQKKKKIEE